MTTRHLRIAPGVQLPDQAVTETFAMLAKRGTGKSNAAVVMAEEMTDAGHQWVAIDPKGDWWGIRSSADGQGPGLQVPVFGGRHGDLPLEATAGTLLARLIVERDLTVVLDVSLFSKADQIRFVTDFAEALFRAVGDAPRPLHLFLEEAEEFLPQRVDARSARMVGAYSKIAKQGRTSGLGVSLITQRSASLNKDALSQTDTLILFRTVSPHDRKAVVAWAEHHDEARDVASSLAELHPGESWILSPGFLGSITKVQWRRRRTFDSGATPVTGKARRKDPVSLADIDLAEIKELMADTVERAKASDPKVLQRRIRDLEQQLAERPVEREVVEVEIPVEVPVISEATLLRLEELLQPAAGLLAEVQEHLTYDTKIEGDTIAMSRVARHDRPGGGAAGNPPTRRERAAAPPAAAPRPTPTRTAPTIDDDEVPLKAGARRLLETVARHHPMVLTRSQVATLAKIKKTGGTFGTYWSLLKRAGYIVEAHDGAPIEVTAAGLARAGVTEPEPLSTDELIGMWRDRLKAGARRMLDHLVDLYPMTTTQSALAEAVDIEVTGGTFGTYLSHLRRNGLVDVDGQEVRASDTLFLGARS